MGDINKLHTLDKAEYSKPVMCFAPQGGAPALNREVLAVALIALFEMAAKLQSTEIIPLVIAEGRAVGVDWVVAQKEFSP